MWSKYPEILSDLKLVEEDIRKNTYSKNKVLHEIISGLFNAGGKRLRPAFVVIASKFGKSKKSGDLKSKVVSVASAIEILHTATLVHDDIVDKAEMRRGHPTIVQTHGSNIALYAGDLLYTKSVLALSKNIPVERLEAIARAIKILCEGEIDQYLDRRNLNVSVFAYLKSIARKTAGLFGAASASGAYIAKCSNEDTKNLARFGFNFGMAFQIRDDLNDFLKNQKVTGKPFCKDISEGVVTLPFIFAFRESAEILAEFQNAFAENRTIHQREMHAIVEKIKETRALQKTQAILDKYIARANHHLSLLPENKYKILLQELLEGLT